MSIPNDADKNIGDNLRKADEQVGDDVDAAEADPTKTGERGEKPLDWGLFAASRIWRRGHSGMGEATRRTQFLSSPLLLLATKIDKTGPSTLT
jgi:hypothetical protein